MREERNILSRGEVSLPQFWALQIIAERGSCLMSDLCSELGMSPSSLTACVDCLCEMKLVRRAADAEDRRAIRVALTARGRRMLLEVIGQKRDMIRRLFSDVPAADRAVYLRVLDQVVAKTENGKRKGRT